MWPLAVCPPMTAPGVTRSALPALDALSERVARRVLAAMTVKRYPRRAVLFRAGESPASLHFVLAGTVRVSRRLDRGGTVLHLEEAGGVLGEIPALGGGPYPATAVAETGVQCAILGGDRLARLLDEEPELARFALRRLAWRARVVLERLDELSASTVTSRLARHLLARASEVPLDGALDLGMTQSALADRLGTAREVLVRSLRALCAAGAIRRTGRSRYALVDRDRLRAIAGTRR